MYYNTNISIDKFSDTFKGYMCNTWNKLLNNSYYIIYAINILQDIFILLLQDIFILLLQEVVVIIFVEHY